MSDEQFELDLEGESHLLIEDTTLTVDKILEAIKGQYEEVLIIGLNKDGACYHASHGNVPQWLFWLRRCEQFLMENTF